MEKEYDFEMLNRYLEERDYRSLREALAEDCLLYTSRCV